MEKLEEYLRDLEQQHEAALIQAYRIEGAIQAIQYMIQEERKKKEPPPDVEQEQQ